MLWFSKLRNLLGWDSHSKEKKGDLLPLTCLLRKVRRGRQRTKERHRRRMPKRRPPTRPATEPAVRLVRYTSGVTEYK
jgi:hypothetical protein